MADISVDIKSNIPEVTKMAEENRQVALEMIGRAAEANAILEITALGAVKTGNLRNSITHTYDEDTAYVGTNVEYAPYVEYGTNRMKARPFLKNAVENHVDEYKQLMELGMQGKD